MPVELSDDAEPEACWMESMDRGWLFLITTGPGRGWLLSTGELPDDPLAGSRLIARRVARLGQAAGRFPAAPRMASELCGLGWLACGSGAMAFDPLCGDGTAHAVREAILASAVIRAAARGEDAERLLSHYRARLTAAFQRHLVACAPYYSTGGAGNWWSSELQAIERGLVWCERELEHYNGFHYRLEGFDLLPLHAAQ
jgi:hypothetical protein